MSPRATPVILLEDNHCLVIDKPAGLPSQPDESGDDSAIDLMRADLKRRYNKPGEAFIGLVHRLDRPTSGVLALAKTSKAGDRLAAQFRDGTVRKIYLAVVEGRPDRGAGVWDDYLLKDESRNVTSIVPAHIHPDAREARVEYRVLGSARGLTTLELRPTTGRSHQLRVQLGSRGLPIVGDRKYGANSSLIALDGRNRIALHASTLTFKHPTRAEVLSVSARLPADWPT